MAKDDNDLLGYAVERVTPCQKRPWACEPRQIKHVAWDADGVILLFEPAAIASSVRGPFKKIDEDTLEAGEEPPFPGVSPPKPKKPKEPEEPKEGWRRLIPFSEEEGEELRGIAEELVGSLPEKQKERLEPKRVEPPSPKPRYKEIRWDPHLQGWFEKGESKWGISWLLMPLAEAPRPPRDKRKEERRFIEVREEAAPPPLFPRPPGQPPLLPPPPAPPEYKYPPYRYGPRKVILKLLPTFRDTLQELKKRGITNSVISLNTPGSVKDILEAFGLADNFVEIRDSWENKGKVFREITATHKITPCDAIFVDDTITNVETVSKECAIALHMGRDIKKPIEILNYILPKKE